MFIYTNKTNGGTMINISEILEKPVGSRFDFSSIETGMNQKRLSAALQDHGWKKDFNHPGEWVRICTWKYLSYYEALDVTINYARLQFIKNIGSETYVHDSDVHIYCGMPLSKEMAAAVMKLVGWQKEGNKYVKGV
jgi:hypothetical protein